MSQPVIRSLLDEFATTLTANFATAAFNPAQAEDQLKGPTQRLLHQVGEAFGLRVVARTEATSELGVRPDIGVTVDTLLSGHLELKAPGKGAQVGVFQDRHDREQAKRLADHPNLIYTDGNEWALYRHGQAVGSVVRAEGDVTCDGGATFGDESSLALEGLLRNFLAWEPLVPASPKALAELLAPLTRLLRENVKAVLADEESALNQLAREWRDYFFPDADAAQFADAYAQTVTYALLLARVEGETDLHARAAERLERRHGLLAQVLRVLTDPSARAEVEVPVELLERSIGAVQPDELRHGVRHEDVWLYFYEDFLAAYDPKLRKQRGVYFTPPEVVQAQTRLVAQLLRERFDKPLSFADDEITVLDPAVGTGTYLLSAFQLGLEAVRESFGDGAIPARASVMAQGFHGFELLIGPYAVAHLRLSQQILAAGGRPPNDGVHVYLTDTLESPHLAPPGLAHAPLFQRKLADENRRARHIKAEVPVLVCLGNPPYFRQVIEPDEEGVERMGGWVRRGDEAEEGILQDFVRDTPGVHAKNLYNLYVYFWRWALWKVFESGPRHGVVSFITASSYLRGPGFAGMRRFMRELLDELWILDVGGEGRGARRSENVFAIQTPVAIAVGIRSEAHDSAIPAQVRYARLDGPREVKLAALAGLGRFEDVAWQDCFEGWTDPFLPKSEVDFSSWPPLTDLFPWQHSGVQFKRTWPIAPDRATLEARWYALISAAEEEKGSLLHETGARKASGSYVPLGGGARAPALVMLPREASPPNSVPYAYRTLDRQYALADNRLIDRPRPPLWKTVSARQLYMTSLLTGLLGSGPAASVTHHLPDLHHFRGSFGGKDVIPLWRDPEATQPNITSELLPILAESLGSEVRPEALFAYCYAVLSARAYVERFAEELEVPGPRVPLARDFELFTRAVELGERLIWLHTYGERFVPDGERAGRIRQGLARSVKPIGSTPEDYPSEHRYDEPNEELHVGAGVFAPVSKAVYGYSVSGLHVVGSWLDYRMRQGAGRRSSELDAIRPTVWPAAFTEELIRLLWIIEQTVALEPDLIALLDAVVAGPVFRADELPEPSDAERDPPR